MNGAARKRKKKKPINDINEKLDGPKSKKSKYASIVKITVLYKNPFLNSLSFFKTKHRLTKAQIAP